MQKYLKLFSLKPDFTEEELKISYRSLCSKYHPDKTKGSTTKLFQEVQVGKKELDEDLKSRKNPFNHRSGSSADYVKSYTSYEDFSNSAQSKPHSDTYSGYGTFQQKFEKTNKTKDDQINHLTQVNRDLKNKVRDLESLVQHLKSSERVALDSLFYSNLRADDLLKLLNLLKEENGKLKNQKPEKKKWWQIF